jgi:hypothetical protein
MPLAQVLLESSKIRIPQKSCLMLQHAQSRNNSHIQSLKNLKFSTYSQRCIHLVSINHSRKRYKISIERQSCDSNDSKCPRTCYYYIWFSLVQNSTIDLPKRTIKRKILKRICLGHKQSEHTCLSDKNVDFFNGSTLDNKTDTKGIDLKRFS